MVNMSAWSRLDFHFHRNCDINIRGGKQKANFTVFLPNTDRATWESSAVRISSFDNQVKTTVLSNEI